MIVIHNDGLSDDLAYAIDEAEMALVKDDPINTELRIQIKASTVKRLEEYCCDHKIPNRIILEVILAAYLYEQGY